MTSNPSGWTTPAQQVWTVETQVTRLVKVELAWVAAGIDVGEVPASALESDLGGNGEDDGPVLQELAQTVTERLALDAVHAGLQADATPIPALVEQLCAILPDAAPHLHTGLTSQDVIDTAMMVGVRASLDLIEADLVASAQRCADLANQHRDTRMRGRTLLQPARTTTFGMRASTWLDGMIGDLGRVTTAHDGMALAWGGAVGTGAGQTEARVAAWGQRLDLTVPELPWHGNRDRIHMLAGSMATIAGQAASRSRDIILLSQAEIAELRDTAAGRSSAMPDKANPAAAVLSSARARVVAAAASGLLHATEVELDRAAGAWQAEADLVPMLMAATGDAVANGRRALEFMEVDAAAMQARAGGDDLGRAGALVDATLQRWHASQQN